MHYSSEFFTFILSEGSYRQTYVKHVGLLSSDVASRW
jgi:hypothetical protein